LTAINAKGEIFIDAGSNSLMQAEDVFSVVTQSTTLGARTLDAQVHLQSERRQGW